MLGLISCGEPRIVASKGDPEPMIAIQGYLLPQQPVNVLITRNFALDPSVSISKFDLLIEDASVVLEDLSQGASYPLAYNPDTIVYEYAGDEDLSIVHGSTYRLQVEATVGGQLLQASTTTTVPRPGFAVIEAQSRLGPLRYREREGGDDGELQNFEIAFRRSPGIDFYVLSIKALDASASTYIYDNSFTKNDSSDVRFFFRELVTAYEWGQSLPTDPDQEPVISTQSIRWRALQFYGRYRAIIYAADQNFKDFFLTHSTTQELDGNFHAPAFHIEGDGVGVFGSAIADTVFFEVLNE